MKPSLQEIYEQTQLKYPNRSSDKGSGSRKILSDPNGHTYAPIYDLLFSKWRDDPIDFLEIGINFGGSLMMWREYFENARSIVGVDIRHSFEPFTASDRIDAFVFDAGSESEVAANFDVTKRFDIIIDDGAHEADSQLKLFQLHRNRVKAGGLYIIEDVQDIVGQFERFNALPERPTIIDRRWVNGRYDDVAIMFQF